MKQILFMLAMIVTCAVALAQTETFYVCMGGDGTLPETATCATAWDITDFNTAANWDTDDFNDGQIGPNDSVLFMDTGGKFPDQLYAQSSGLSGKPITFSNSGTPVLNTSFLEGYPLPSGTTESTVYTVKVNGESLQVEKRSGTTDNSYVWFEFAGEVDIEVTVNAAVTSHTISPKSYGISSSVDGTKISFSLDRPRYLILHEVNAIAEMLFIIADPPEDSRPIIDGITVVDINNCGYAIDNTGVADDTTDIQACIDDISAAGGGTLYFTPGKYKADDLLVKDDVNVYLAPGSRIIFPTNYSWFYFQDLTSTVKLYGRGVLQGHMINVDNSDNITVEGVLVMPNANDWWAVRVEGADNFSGYGIKVINDWAITNDCIHNNFSSSYLVDNVFCFSGDDAFAVTATNITPDNILGSNVRNSVAYTGSSGVKYGSDAYNTTNDDLTWENIDIVSFSHSAVNLNPGDGASVTDAHFKRIRVEKWIDRSLGDEYLIRFAPWKRAASASNLLRVQVIDLVSDLDDTSTITGVDTTDRTVDVDIDGYVLNGTLVTDTTSGNITTNAWVDDLTFSDSGPSVVGVEATDMFCSEAGGDTCVFTVSRTGSTVSVITVDYLIKGTATSGTDYTAISGTATIGAAASSTTVTITPLSDSDEGWETVLLSLVNEVYITYGYILGPDYQAQAVILDGTGDNLFDQDGGLSSGGNKGSFDGGTLVNANLITNGTMEADSNWTDVNTPTTNERSTEQVYKGTYSRKIVSDASWEGIKSDVFTTTTGKIYSFTYVTYPVTTDFSYGFCVEGDGVGAQGIGLVDPTANGVNNWNPAGPFYYMEVTGGASARCEMTAYNKGAVTFYNDDVRVQEIDISWARQGTNTMVLDAGGQSDDALKISGDASSDKGAVLTIADSTDFSSDLLVGATYVLSFWAKVEATESVDVEIAESDDTQLDSVTVTATTFTLYTLTFEATHATTNKIQLDNLGSGEDIWLDSMTLRKDASYGLDLNAKNYLTISDLLIENSPGAGILASGTNATISNVKITGAATGISDSGGTNTYNYSIVDTVAIDGVLLTTAGSVFQNMTIYSAAGDGIELQANGTIKNVIFENITGSDINENGGTATTATNYADAAGDPLFVDPANGDFHLKVDSPARDAGTDVGLTQDFDGLQVPLGAGFDIGAFEINIAPIRRRIGFLDLNPLPCNVVELWCVDLQGEN